MLWVLGSLGDLPRGQDLRAVLRRLLRVRRADPVRRPGDRRRAAGADRAVRRPNRSTRVWLVIAFTALQQLEGHVVAPNVFAQALRINPLLVIFALLLGGQLYGLIGAFIALPIAAMMRETVVYFRRHLVLEPWGTPSAAGARQGPAGARGPPATSRRRTGAARSAARPAPAGAAFCPRAAPSCGAGRRRPPPRPSAGARPERWPPPRPDARPALRAEAVAKRYGDRRALQDVSLRGRAGRADRGHRAQRRRQDHAAADPRRRRSRRPAGAVRGAARRSAGCRSSPRVYSQALGRREPAPVRPPGEGRRRRRDGGAGCSSRRACAERAGDEVGRLSGGNRQRREHRASACSPSRRSLLLDEPSSSLDPRQREVLWEFVGGLAARRDDRRLLDPRRRARPSATPTACSCWPTASCCSRARPPSSSGPCGDARRRAGLRGGVRPLPARARALTPACAGCCSRTCRSCAARRCWSALLVALPGR